LALCFSLCLLIYLYGVNHIWNSSFARVLREREQAIHAETLIHQQLNILANDCDLSDKHVHYLHALHSDDCAQSDKLNNTNR
jgi:hypothetical protein